MAGLTITLYTPNVCVLPYGSLIGIVSSGLAFGSIYKINPYSIYNVAVGKNVAFKRTDATLITQNPTSYYIIDGTKLLFTEDTGVAPEP